MSSVALVAEDLEISHRYGGSAAALRYGDDAVERAFSHS
ncbi:hypothetical protein ACVJGD_004513 [Bradyrhizobium sp. USDA 10063]